MNFSGEVVVGRFVRFDNDGDALLDDGIQPKAVTPSSLKPAPAPVVKVPAGTRFGYGGFPDDDPFEFIEEARLRDGKWHGRHAWVSGGRMVEQTERALDCANVRILPRPSQKPVPAQAGLVGPSGQTNVRSTESPEPGQSPPDPYAGYDLNAWGIAAVKRPVTTCNEPGCGCPYCRHRAFSPKLGANDARYNGGKGPAHSTLDASIASARHATEREAGVKRFDAWVSTRHARTVK